MPKKSKREIKDERKLAATISTQIHLAMGWMGGELSSLRANATEYYLGHTFGDEIPNSVRSNGLSPDGRSRVNSLDVMDSIEWAMPSLMRIFFSSENFMRFDPVNEEDEEQAEQATDYVIYQVTKRNPGYAIFNDWFKDALLHKVGVVKAWWEDSYSYTQESYDNLTDEEYIAISQDADLELQSHEEVTIVYDGTEIVRDEKLVKKSELPKMTVHDAVFRRCHTTSGPRIEVIAPEYMGISRTQRRADFVDCDYCHMRVDMQRYKLVEMGFDYDEVMELSFDDQIDNPEQLARYDIIDEQRLGLYQSADAMTQIVPVYECYIRLDNDDSGITELHKVLWSCNKVLSDEVVDEIPFHAITPIMVPHKFFGQSLADQTMDIQRIKSVLLRQIIDNNALQNDRTVIIDRNKVPVEDLLTSRPGKIVRVNGSPQDAIMYAPQSGITDVPFTLLQYMDKIKEGRIGIGQTTQGLNEGLLNNNKGDSTVAQMMSAAEQRLECIARTFAETGIKSLFMAIYKMLLKFEDKSTVLKLRNKWVEVDPRQWRDRTDVTINVGLGTGEKTKQIMGLMQNLNMQQQVVQAGGMNSLVTPKNIYNNLVDLLEMQGVKFAGLYWQDPTSPEAQKAAQAQSQNQKPDPQQEAIQAQLVIEKQRNDTANQKLETDKYIKTLELQLKKKDLDHQHELDMLQLALDAHNSTEDHKDRVMDMNLKYRQQGDKPNGYQSK